MKDKSSRRKNGNSKSKIREPRKQDELFNEPGACHFDI